MYKYVVNNDTARLVTTARHHVSLSPHLRSDTMCGGRDLQLSFDEDNCTVTAPEGSPYTITGTGTFESDAYTWGGKPRNGIELNYTVVDGANNTYEASEVIGRASCRERVCLYV